MSPFDTLPLEIMQEILKLLDPIAILRATLNCRALYIAFNGAAPIILAASLRRSVDKHVLQEAIASHRAKRLGSFKLTEENAVLFAKSFIPQEGSNHNQSEHYSKERFVGTLEDAVWIFTTYMTKYNSAFAHTTDLLRRNSLPSFLPPRPPRHPVQVPLHNDIRSIVKAWYRFRCYCKLIARTDLESSKDLWEACCGRRFGDWEEFFLVMRTDWVQVRLKFTQ